MPSLCVAPAVGREARLVAEVRASDVEVMIAHLRLLIAKLRDERFGAFSEAMEPTQGLTLLLTPGGTGTKTGRQLDRVGEGPIRWNWVSITSFRLCPAVAKPNASPPRSTSSTPARSTAWT